MKDKGWLWICEVRSRFAGQAGASGGDGAEAPDDGDGGPGGSGAPSSWVMVSFTKALHQLGFKLAQRRVVNKMFVLLELQKVKPAAAGGTAAISWPALKGCVYRKR